jgi:dihydrofolate synthase/folylpolyglutamate synthase
MSSHSTEASEKEAWSLNQWLKYLESTHSKSIDLGLSRVQQVYSRLNLDFSCITVVTVAGTNGKGTTCAFLEMASISAGKSVAVYSSPHLIDYRERVRVNREMLTEEQHCRAFLAIDNARLETPLSYFEFATLAGLYLIAHSDCEVALLEIGLGGRLDAVNIVEPNLAVITSIGLDHQDWLGSDKDSIGREKAGIFRHDISAVIGEQEPIDSLIEAVAEKSVNALWQGKDFGYVENVNSWDWHYQGSRLINIDLPQIPVQNVSTALAVLAVLNIALSNEQINQIIKDTRLPGRYQVVRSEPKVVLDVAHNPQASLYLKHKISLEKYDQLHLVVAMLADKDINASIEPMFELGAKWYTADLNVPRGAPSDVFQPLLVGQELVLASATVYDAYHHALTKAKNNDLVVVFGSFFTVAEILEGEV